MATDLKSTKTRSGDEELNEGLILEVDSIASESDYGRSNDSRPPSSGSIVEETETIDEDLYVTETYYDDALAVESEYESDIEKTVSQSSLQSTPDRPQRFTIRLLHEWCAANQLNIDLASIKPQALDKLLCRFYAEIRSKNGQRYSRNTIMAIRYGLNRHFASMDPPRELDIIDDKAFKNSNNVFKSVVRNAARENPEKSSPRISPEDLRKLYNSSAFSTSSPITLLFKVWFEVSVYFSRKRSKAQRDTKISDFVFDVDEDGRRFATEIAKNDCRPRFRMYEKVGDRMCPVASLEELLTKVDPNCQYLFQRPRQIINDSWFYPERIGRNFASQIMGKISKIAQLSHKYTNVSIKKLTSWNIEELVFQHRFLIRSVDRYSEDRPPAQMDETPSKHEGSSTLQAFSESGVSRAILPSQTTKSIASNTEERKGAFRPYARKRTHVSSEKNGPEPIDVSTAKAKVKRIFQRLEYPDLVSLVDWLKRIDVLKDTSGTVFCRENCLSFIEHPQTPRHFTPQQVKPLQPTKPHPFILPSPLSVSNYLMNGVVTNTTSDPYQAAIYFPPFSSHGQSSLRLPSFDSNQQTTLTNNSVPQVPSQTRIRQLHPIAPRPSHRPSQEQVTAMRSLQLGISTSSQGTKTEFVKTVDVPSRVTTLNVTKDGKPTISISQDKLTTTARRCGQSDGSASDFSSASSSPHKLKISEVTGESKVWKIL